MISILKKSAYRHGYLFIIAAWLYTLSFLFTNYFSYDSNPDKVSKILSQYISAKEKHFNNLIADTSLLKSIITDRGSDVKTKLNEEDIGIFTYALNDRWHPVQLYWNTNTMAVNPGDLENPDGEYAVTYQKSYFVLLKRTIRRNNQDYLVLGLIPVHWQYEIEKDQLQSRFAKYPELEKNYQISITGNGIPVINTAGKQLFYIQKKEAALFDQPETLSIILRVAAILILMVFVNVLARELAEQNGFLSGFLFLFTVVTAARTLSYFFHFPFDYSKLDLFDSIVYASSNLNKSLGDLLINTILFSWLVSFMKFNYHYLKYKGFLLDARFKKIIGTVALFILPLFTIWMAGYLSSLIIDSSDQLSFDVTNFFSLNGNTLVSFLIICFLLLSFFYISQLLVKISMLLPYNMYWRIMILLSFALLFLSLNIPVNNSIVLNFALIAWLTIFYAFLTIRKNDAALSFYNSAWFMPWSIFLMASVTSLLIFQNKSLEEVKRKSFADKISRISDPANETIVNMAVNKFSEFFLEENFNRFYNATQNKLLKSSIINSNFRGYLNNFYTRIYTYDSSFKPLYNEDSTSYNEIKAIITNQGIPTGNKNNLYYYENAFDQFSYIYEKEIKPGGSLLKGYVFLLIRPRAYKKEELTPELFRQLLYSKNFPGNKYPYAVYDKFNLVKKVGNYNFTDTISKKDVPKFETYFIEKDGYSELWYNSSSNKVIMVPKKDNWLEESVTFFAYIFGLFIILSLIQHFGGLVFKTRFRWPEIKKIFRFNIRTQIQAIIVMVTLLSFIIIGITTISFFIYRFNNSNDEKLRTNAQIMENEIEGLVKNRIVYSDMFNVSNIDLKLELEKSVIQIAETHNTDINFFDLGGNLQVSSQPYLYDNKILSRKMNAVAYNEMHYKRSTQFIQKETVVGFSYLNIYVPVKDEDGSTLAYLNVPFINSENELSQEISNFLITVINLNALIFIMAGAIAIWVTSRITSSFTLIADKMKALSFGSVNEPIEWKRDDELGELVTEYNKMVTKLVESANALARSEREGAWREMARQVAHEIKNPLTPMKLSIQYLEKAIDNNAPNIKQLSKQVAVTLVEQIDQLSKIAGDFSQFANIANVNEEEFELSDTIDSIILLFSADDRISITWKKEKGRYFIKADKIQMNRMFTNLIKNAVEAYTAHEKAFITIRQRLKQKEIIISIQDKGGGIPANMQSKIFTPNFTTKSSGTGLGLAICKGIAEKANGHIWFETKENEGSVFFVSLPLVQL